MPNRQSKPIDLQKAPVAADANGRCVEREALLAARNGGSSLLEYGPDRIIFLQGDPADSVFYLRRGKVKLSVTSPEGKEGIVALLEDGDFLGEGCLAGQPLRMATATAMMDSAVHRIEKPLMMRMLHEQLDVSEFFAERLLSRNIRFEQDLIDHLFNQSEKRLARILLLLAHFGEGNKAETVLPRINQETLAEMVGTTRSRVSHFMNEFRNCGCIDYGNRSELTVHSSLLDVVLNGGCKPLEAGAIQKR